MKPINTNNPLSLSELGTLVEDIVREHTVDAHVVGVTPTGENGSYAEVLVTAPGDRSALSIGLRRDYAVDDIQRDVAARLTEWE